MTIQIVPVIINIVLCALIIVRVIIFRRKKCRYKPGVSLLAWLLAVSCCMVIISLLSGIYQLAGWAEIIINCVFCISIYLASGNLSNLLKSKD